MYIFGCPYLIYYKTPACTSSIFIRTIIHKYYRIPICHNQMHRRFDQFILNTS